MKLEALALTKRAGVFVMRRLSAATQAGLYYQRRRNRRATSGESNFAPPYATVTFTVNPSNTDTITFSAGTPVTITLVSGTPGAGQVKLGATLAATLLNIETYFAANPATGIKSIQRTGDAGLLMLSAVSAGVSEAQSISTTVTGTTIGGGDQLVRSRPSIDAAIDGTIDNPD